MGRLLRWYGAGPLHLLTLLGCFALAGYAAARLVPSRPLGIAVWFLGAVIGHDLLLMPLYTLADRSAAAVLRHRAARLPARPWINYLRVPAALSGLLFLVWFPLILRLRTRYQASTTLSPDPYLWHWLAVTGALFLVSAVALALRVRALRQPSAPPQQPPAPPAPPEQPPASPASLEELPAPPAPLEQPPAPPGPLEQPPASPASLEQPPAQPRPLPPPSATGAGDAVPGPLTHSPVAEPPGNAPADQLGRADGPAAGRGTRAGPGPGPVDNGGGRPRDDQPG